MTWKWRLTFERSRFRLLPPGHITALGTHLRTWTGTRGINSRSSPACHIALGRGHEFRPRFSRTGPTYVLSPSTIRLPARDGAIANARLESSAHREPRRVFARGSEIETARLTTWSAAHEGCTSGRASRANRRRAALGRRATNDAIASRPRRTTGASFAQACDPRGRPARDTRHAF